ESIRYCLDTAGARMRDIAHVGISRDPRSLLHKKVLFTLRNLPSLSTVHDRLNNAARVLDVREVFVHAFGARVDRVRMVPHRGEHHTAHMAPVLLVASFDEAACLSIDGFGVFLSAKWGAGKGGSISALGSVTFPHSLGIFYTAITQCLGFLNYGDEYKVMGMA